jgi:DNA-directed RNA polymerase subunit M/transcription elongation factor TFIIS
MIFCPGCDNIFNYDEDTENKTLSYLCKTCEIDQPLENNCLSTKTLKTKKIPFINYHDAIYDKTLPIRKSETCNKCKQNNIAFIRNEDLSVIYICKNPECRNIIQHSKI